MSTPLFQFGEFLLASGKLSHFKLECDAISPQEWHTLARIALPLLPDFGRVECVPEGGRPWATIFQHYVRPGSRRYLLVDDVWTTGQSMLSQVIRSGAPWHGIVLFARGPVPKNVTALFMLHEDLQ
jgi:orotate phosphoribosyltransferase